MLDGKNDSGVVENLGIGKLYENKVGVYLFNVFFFLISIFDGIIAGEQSSCLCTCTS